MPGLVLFGRRWAIASDDFVFPSVGEFLLRVAWLVTLVIIFAEHYNGFECSHGHQLRAFYIGSLIFDSLGIIIVIALLRVSMKGTIRDGWPRRHIRFYLYTRVAYLLPEVIWACLSTYWAFGHEYKCSWTVVWTARGAVICLWLVGLVAFISMLVVFDPLGSRDQRHSVTCSVNNAGESGITVGNASAHKVWEKRCRLLCCCIACSQDTREAFTDVGKLVADFFHDLDLVPSDIAAGLMLVQKQQVHAEHELSQVVISNNEGEAVSGDSPLQSESALQPKSWMTIANMAHYMKFAMGSYGWPFYVYQNLTTGACRLCGQCRCCSCCRRANQVFKDNICQCNTAAIKKLANVKEEDLIYVTFHNKFKQVPFYVVVDRAKHAVVISIRGTLSLSDALADLNAMGANLEIPGVENSYCHAAMLDCAKYIQNELQSMRVLDTAFAQLGEGAGLVITGHSLGAGVASILAVLLRPEYPNLICFSFSPPGGLMSRNASKHTQDFVCSVVIGKDLVPRLGMYTLIDLKVKILRALCESHEPKFRILASGCLRLVCCIGPSAEDQSDRALIRDRSGARYMEENNTVLQDALRLAESQLEEVVRTEWPLHPAGQILHVVEMNEEVASCCEAPQYCAFWSSAEFFDRIVISHNMVSDHIPNTVGDALDQLYERNYVPQSRRTTRVMQHV